MTDKTTSPTQAPRPLARDRKRADALRKNLLKRKQQTRTRDAAAPHDKEEK